MKLSEINPNELTPELIKNIFFNIKKEEYDIADYLVIYGCHIKELLNERLNHALKIINTKQVKQIVVTGGVGLNGNFNESEYMKEYLINNGVNQSKIITESKSTITLENDVNVIELLDLKNTNKLTNIVQVSHEPHLVRVKMHWDNLLSNNNLKLYYDYVEETKLTYENVIKNEELIKEAKVKLELIQEYINDGYLNNRKII